MRTAELERRQRAVQSAQNVRDFYERKARRLEVELDETCGYLATAEDVLQRAGQALELARAPLIFGVDSAKPMA